MENTVLLSVLLIFIVVYQNAGQKLFTRRMANGYTLKQRLQETINQVRQRNTQTICYETVGCFDLPHKRSPLQKEPEDPVMLNTRFYLFRRNGNFSHPELLSYVDNGTSLKETNFNYSQPLKLIIHGYMGKWNEIGMLLGADSYLKIYDSNVVLMDWSMGARGPQYAIAAANTELVGRELGILMLQMIEMGLKPYNIHLLGFSLGAHVAGTASEVLKKRGYLIERITGLDAASPLFRTNHLREQTKKLDKSDAKYVDVIHTDSSPSITDGFGLWQPIGHVDFFPNGGQEQPGCTDIKQSIVTAHFDKSLTRQVACSHIRAWRLFEETLLMKASNSTNQCKFIAYSCPGGLRSFERGYCFPSLPKPSSKLALDPTYRNDIGQFGEDNKGNGVMFFSTRASPPYCGTQLQIAIHLSQKTEASKGTILIRLAYRNELINTQINFEVGDFLVSGSVLNGLFAVTFNSLSEDLKKIEVGLQFVDGEFDEENNNTYTPTIYFDKIVVRDMYNNFWQFCQKDTTLQDSTGLNSTVSLTLTKTSCF